jgi:hypothetical protein
MMNLCIFIEGFIPLVFYNEMMPNVTLPIIVGNTCV